MPTFKSLDFFQKKKAEARWSVDAQTWQSRAPHSCNGDIFGRNKHRVKDQNIKLSNVLWATSTTMAKKPWANHTSHTFRYELMEKPCFGWCLSHGSPTISIEPQLARSWNFTYPNVACHCRRPKTYPASQTANTFQNASWEWCLFSGVQRRQPSTPGQSNWRMTNDSVWCCQLFSMRSFKGLCS